MASEQSALPPLPAAPPLTPPLSPCNSSQNSSASSKAGGRAAGGRREAAAAAPAAARWRLRRSPIDDVDDVDGEAAAAAPAAAADDVDGEAAAAAPAAAADVEPPRAAPTAAAARPAATAADGMTTAPAMSRTVRTGECTRDHSDDGREPTRTFARRDGTQMSGSLTNGTTCDRMACRYGHVAPGIAAGKEQPTSHAHHS